MLFHALCYPAQGACRGKFSRPALWCAVQQPLLLLVTFARAARSTRSFAGADSPPFNLDACVKGGPALTLSSTVS